MYSPQQSLKDIHFTIFDTETTGLSAACGERIIEIGALRWANGRVQDVFESFIYTGRCVSPGAYRVNGISQGMLKGAPAAGKVLPLFLDFSKGSCLCAYNACFDMGFLKSELCLLGCNPPPEEDFTVADIMLLAKRILPGLPSYSLINVARALSIPTMQAHRALSDAMLSLKVFRKLLSNFKTSGADSWERFMGLCGISVPSTSPIVTARKSRALPGRKHGEFRAKDQMSRR